MKLYIKRDQFKKFERGRIEFDDVLEWTLLSAGLEELLEYHQETLEFYRNLKNTECENKDDDRQIEYHADRIKLVETMLQVLEHKNELSWEDRPK